MSAPRQRKDEASSRSEQELADEFDEAIDRLRGGEALTGAVSPRLRAARALFETLPESSEPPPERYIAVRAALAAQAEQRRRVASMHSRLLFQLGSAAAILAVVLAVVTDSGRSPVTTATGTAEEQQATQILQVLHQSIDDVRESVESGDRAETASRSQEAVIALNEAKQAARLLPPGNPVRDKVLADALEKLDELQSLVTRLDLPVPPLPGSATSATSPAAASEAPTTTAATVPRVSTTTTTSTTIDRGSTTTVPAPTTVPTTVPTTTPTTEAPPPSTTTTTKPQPAPTTTTSTSTTTTSTTTTSTTTTSTTIPRGTTTTTLAPPSSTTTAKP
ncbi:MAG: hypothetical protein ACRDZW_11955, partial [Acidimicrobiales bacterium]